MELHFENGYFGIRKDGLTIVPFEHETPKSAVDEWVMWETTNITEPFLDYVLTEEEIKMVADRLLGKDIDRIREKTLNKLKGFSFADLQAFNDETAKILSIVTKDELCKWETICIAGKDAMKLKMDGFLNDL